MKPGRITGKGGMRQKTAENSTGKRNNVENFIEIVVFAVLVGDCFGGYSLAVLPAVRGKYVGDGTVSFRYEGIHSGNAGTGQRLQLSLSDPLQAGGSDPSGHRQSAHRNGTGHGAGSDVAEQRSDDRPENNAGQACWLLLRKPYPR